MVDEVPVISTPNGYRDKHVKDIKLASGEVFKVRAMNALSTVELMKLLQGSDLKTLDMKQFVLDHLDKIIPNVIMPSVIEPKIFAEDYMLLDVIEILGNIMQMSGILGPKAEENESFRPDGSSPSP